MRISENWRLSGYTYEHSPDPLDSRQLMNIQTNFEPLLKVAPEMQQRIRSGDTQSYDDYLAEMRRRLALTLWEKYLDAP